MALFIANLDPVHSYFWVPGPHNSKGLRIKYIEQAFSNEQATFEEGVEHLFSGQKSTCRVNSGFIEKFLKAWIFDEPECPAPEKHLFYQHQFDHEEKQLLSTLRDTLSII